MQVQTCSTRSAAGARKGAPRPGPGPLQRRADHQQDSHLACDASGRPLAFVLPDYCPDAGEDRATWALSPGRAGGERGQCRR